MRCWSALSKGGKSVASGVVFLAAVVAVLGFLGYDDVSEMFGDDLATVQNELQNENGIAPRVAFSDGSVCKVAFSATFRLPEENVLAVHERYLSFENAEKAFKTAAVAALVSELEKTTLPEVRADRGAHEDKIEQVIKRELFSPGYELEKLQLLEITC